MKNVAISFGVALVICGCSKADDEWPEYTARSGDLTGFIVESAIKVGARPRATNGLPQINGDWHFKNTNDRIQVVLTGNHFQEVQSILTNAFGPLPQPATKSERSIGASLGPEVGANISITWDKTTDDKEYTTLVMTRAQSPPKAP